LFGNFAILEAGANHSIGNRAFAEKRIVYAQSAFEVTRRIAADNDETTGNLLSRPLTGLLLIQL